jgi:hypothetical protein
MTSWYLEPDVPNLLLLRLLLRERMIRLGESLSWSRLNQGQSPELPKWVSLDLLPSASLACEAFDVSFGQDLKSRWALCFDELELAPSWLLKTAFSDLRTVDLRLIFKLGTSPHPNVVGSGNASALNDFDPISYGHHHCGKDVSSAQHWLSKSCRTAVARHNT